jgi:hypothetical protein
MRQPRRNVLTGLLATVAALALPARGHASGSHGSSDGGSHAGGHHGGTANGAIGAAGQYRLASSAAFDGQGRLWVARVENTGPTGAGSTGSGASNTAPASAQIVLSWTRDDGRTWSNPIAVLRTPEPVEANGEGRPKLAFGPGGQFYLSYTRPSTKPHTGDIRFVRSIDGGATFSEPVTLQSDTAQTGHRFDSIIVDHNGRIFVAWIDKRDLDAARRAGRPYRGAAIYYTVSRDEGRSFAPDAKVADHCCECCRIALALTPGGEVVAMWRHIFEPNVRDHAMATLPLSGPPGAVTRVSFDQWKIDACPHHGPSVALDHAGRRHQVWFSAGSDDSAVFYASTDVQGVLGKPVPLGAVQAEHGELAVAGSRIVIVWKEFDGKLARVVARHSSDGGATWQHQLLATSAGSSDHPHLVRRGTELCLVWNTEQAAVIIRRIGEPS